MNYGRAVECWWLTREEDDQAKWARERSETIGGSDLPAIMSPGRKKSRRSLLREKQGQARTWPGNFATRKGHHMEPFLRAEFTKATGIEVHKPPKPLEHPDCKLRVNLDAWGPVDSIPVELKCAPHKVLTKLAQMKEGIAYVDGKWRMLNRVAGKYPAIGTTFSDYLWQLQGQMFVPNSPYGYFGVDCSTVDLQVVKVAAQPEAWEAIEREVNRFWDDMAKAMPPEPPEDYRVDMEMM